MGEIDEELSKIREKKLKELERRLMGGKSKSSPAEPVEVTERTFDQVIRNNPLVVVDFWAQWCPPCRMISPIVEELARKYAGKVVFGKLNVDENPSVAARYGIMSIPTILYFKNGELRDEIVGAVPAEFIEEKIKKLL